MTVVGYHKTVVIRLGILLLSQHSSFGVFYFGRLAQRSLVHFLASKHPKVESTQTEELQIGGYLSSETVALTCYSDPESESA